MIFFAEVALTALDVGTVAFLLLLFFFYLLDVDKAQEGSPEEKFAIFLMFVIIASAFFAVVCGAIYGIHAVWSLA